MTAAPPRPGRAPRGPDDLPASLGPVRGRRPLGGGDVGAAEEVLLADGRRLFVKRYERGGGEDMVTSEAAGLRWIGEPEGAPPVPVVVAAEGRVLVLEMLDVTGGSSLDAAGQELLGRGLAALHAAGADAHGAVPPGAVPVLGSMRLPVRPVAGYAAFWAEQRVLPLARAASDAGHLSPADLRAVEDVAGRAADVLGPVEPPARCHGDLWWGNVVRARDGRPWLFDPSAHGGHREADLALLDLFGGVPDRVLAAYEDVTPLADGWQERVGLHQLPPLLSHAARFGGAYGPAAGAAARGGRG